MSDDIHSYRAGYCPSHGTYVGYCPACATLLLAGEEDVDMAPPLDGAIEPQGRQQPHASPSGSSSAASTDNLIEQARRWNGTGSALDTAELLLELADALETAEGERDAAQRAEKHVARAMQDVMAERDALADA